MKEIIFALCCVFLVAPSQAQTWHLLWETGDERDVWYVDSGSLVKTPTTISAWTKIVSNPKFLKSGDVFTTMAQMKVNCSERTMANITAITYDANGDVKGRKDSQFALPVSIVPGTTGQTFSEALCEPGFPRPDSKLYRVIEVSPEESAKIIFQFFAIQKKKK